MRSIEQKVAEYKRGVIRSYSPFFMKGLLTASELESLASSSSKKFELDLRRAN